VTLASARLRTSHERTLPCHRLGAHPAPGQGLPSKAGQTMVDRVL